MLSLLYICLEWNLPATSFLLSRNRHTCQIGTCLIKIRLHIALFEQFNWITAYLGFPAYFPILKKITFSYELNCDPRHKYEASICFSTGEIGWHDYCFFSALHFFFNRDRLRQECDYINKPVSGANGCELPHSPSEFSTLEISYGTTIPY